MTPASRAAAVAAGVCLVAAGCSAASRHAAAQSATPTATAAASASAAAACRLLTAAQVREAVGRPIGHARLLPPGLCVYRFPARAGGVNFSVASFPSAAQARRQFRQREQADSGVRGLTVTKIRGLGQEAVTLTDSGGVSAVVLANSKELDVNVSLTGATPHMAITLAAEAIHRI